MEIQKLERRTSEYALFESQRELESPRLQLFEDIHWADQAQRERILLCSELEMKNRLHQESCARSCQEIEELKKRCYKEENRVTQQKLNENSMQQDQESRTVSLLRDQVQKLKERLEFIEDSKIFQDPDSPSSFWQCPRFASSSYHLEFKKGQPRIENAAKYTRGHEYSRKRF